MLLHVAVLPVEHTSSVLEAAFAYDVVDDAVIFFAVVDEAVNVVDGVVGLVFVAAEIVVVFIYFRCDVFKSCLLGCTTQYTGPCALAMVRL